MNPQPRAAPIHHGSRAVAPALVVTVVHGTFPRGPLSQIRRNIRSVWTRACGRPFDEAALWRTQAPQVQQRRWFEAGSEFERDLARLTGLPQGSIVFEHFPWSGRNTFAERAEAARGLRVALRTSAQKYPGVRQVVLAHSHGGTVAAKALDVRGGAETPAVQATLTLGTPFVRLVPRWPSVAGKGRSESVWVAALLPMLLLLLAPMMTLYYGLRSESGTEVAAAVALGALAVGAMVRASLITSAGIVALVLCLGGARLGVIDWVVILVVLFLAYGVLGKTVVPLLFDAGWRHVEEEPLRLACTLLALRAPRDEASLVIGLGQVAQALGHAGMRLMSMLMRPFRRAGQLGATAPRLQKALHNLTYLLLLAMLALGLLTARGFDPWELPFPYAPTGVFGVIVAVCLAVSKALFTVVLVLLVFVLAWSLPAMAISLATGREAFLLPAVTQVEAEPLPYAVSPDARGSGRPALEILYNARPSGMNHSLYDAPEVRERIAEWLREQAASGSAYGAGAAGAIQRDSAG